MVMLRFGILQMFKAARVIGSTVQLTVRSILLLIIFCSNHYLLYISNTSHLPVNISDISDSETVGSGTAGSKYTQGLKL